MRTLLPKNSLYLLPNLITASGLFAGFYSIIFAMSGNVENAAIAVIIAAILDGFDGRVARLTNTKSSFGEQFDNLADMVSFGIAPAMVAFSWILHDAGKWGWAAAFFYVVCTAFRLCRFAVLSGNESDNHDFLGLPSPAAAVLAVCFIWTFEDYWLFSETWMLVLTAVVMVIIGLLMVSKVPFFSAKQSKLHNRKISAFHLLLIVVTLILVLVIPNITLLTLTSLYILYALVMATLTYCKKH